MVEKYKAYPEYKDSGVKWLGKIPSNWSVIPLKRYFSIINGSTPKAGNDNFWNGDIIWITPSDLSKLTSFDIINSTRKITKSGLASCGTSIVPINSIILSCRAPIGSIGLAKVELCTNQGCKSLVPFQDSSSYFYAYVLSICTEELNAKGKGTTFLELSNDELGYFSLPKPTIKEQRNIVIFLDYETYKIDTLIKQQQQLIKLLEEKRQAVISHAVTKGLNPNVSMKDSGVAWLGAVNNNCEVLPIKYIVSTPVTDGPHETPKFLDEGIPFISAEAIDNGHINFEKIRGYISFNEHKKYSKKYKPQKEDIYIVKSGATTGKIAKVNTDKDFNIWSPLAAIRCCSTKIISDFAYFYFQSKEFQTAIELNWSYGTQQNIGMAVIQNLKINIPKIREQKQIIDFLNKETSSLNQLIVKANKVIALLKERRKALISAAVTGKIDVRNWQAPTVTD